MGRRRSVFVASVVLLAALTGCSAGPQNRQVTGSGTPATLSAATVDEAGLSEARAANQTLSTRVEETVSGDVSVRAVVDVDVTTPVREYRGEGVAVGVVSTPAVQPVEGRGAFRDPLTELTPAEQAAHAQSAYSVTDLGEGERVRNVTLLGTETPLHRFEGTADGEAVSVYLTRARDGDDFVTVVVVTPAGRNVDVAGVVRGVEH